MELCLLPSSKRDFKRLRPKPQPPQLLLTPRAKVFFGVEGVFAFGVAHEAAGYGAVGQAVGVANFVEQHFEELFAAVAGLEAERRDHAGLAWTVTQAHHTPIGYLAFGGADVGMCEAHHQGIAAVEAVELPQERIGPVAGAGGHPGRGAKGQGFVYLYLGVEGGYLLGHLPGFGKRKIGKRLQYQHTVPGAVVATTHHPGQGKQTSQP